ncbi:MAG: hypothetical protein ACR2QO_17785 [Acidimicrobiales bacterium]
MRRMAKGVRALWPVAAGFLLLASVLLLLEGVGVLGSWTEIYGPSGQFVVEECAVSAGRLATRAECAGDLILDSGDGVASTMVGPKAAFGSSMPAAGTEVSAYYRAGDPSLSFPLEAQPTELARVIVGLVPVFFVACGITCWLVGWVLTRKATSEDLRLDPTGDLWPARFTLRSRGVAWALVGFAWLGFDRFLVGDLLGTAGLG